VATELRIGSPLPLPIVDGRELPAPYRRVLRPGEPLEDRTGRPHTLPTRFYEVDSWETALGLELTPHFMLWEFLTVDVREAAAQRTVPRYVPCTVTVLAAHLELFRLAAGTYVHIAANGGYRSPAHALSRHASTHCWGSAVNLYRIGDVWLDTPDAIDRFARLALSSIPGVWARPWGHEDGLADDHLHLDLGWVIAEPRPAG
jgi:hypothetical protein